MTSSFFLSRASRCSILAVPTSTFRERGTGRKPGSVLKEGFLPLVEERGMGLVRITDRGDPLFLDKVAGLQEHFPPSAMLPANPGGEVLVLSLVFLAGLDSQPQLSSSDQIGYFI